MYSYSGLGYKGSQMPQHNQLSWLYVIVSRRAFLSSVFLYFIFCTMNNLLTTTVNKLLYDGEKYRWTGSLNELKDSLISIYKLKGNGPHLVVMLNYLPLRLLISLLNGMAHVRRSLRLKLIAVITI